MLKDNEKWMKEHDFATIDNFRGKLTQDKTTNPAAWERAPFVKNFRQVIRIN